MMNDPRSPSGPAPDVSVCVQRTGGFAGLTREWEVAPGPGDERSAWIALIDSCPWPRAEDGGEVGARSAPTGAADRFAWEVRARHPLCDERVARLTDDQVTGAWGALIDAVRAAARGSNRRQ